MTPGPSIDGVLVQWGERPFYPASRIVNPTPTHRGHRGAAGAAGDGQGHGWRSRHGGHRRALPLHQQERQLDIEDDRGVVREGKEALHNLVEQWHHSGSLVDEVGHRREAFNIMLSMPHGTDAQIVRKAAREVRVHGVHRRRLTQLQTDGDGCAPRGRGRPSAGRHGGQRPSKQARRRGVGDGREHGGMHELPQVHALAQTGLMNAEATSHKVVAAQ